MSIKETQIDWALDRFDKAARASEGRDEAMNHLAVGLTHLCMELKVIGYRISRLEGEAGLEDLED